MPPQRLVNFHTIPYQTVLNYGFCKAEWTSRNRHWGSFETISLTQSPTNSVPRTVVRPLCATYIEYWPASMTRWVTSSLIPLVPRSLYNACGIKKRDWDDPCLPADPLQTWTEWEEELPALQNIVLPRCYSSPIKDSLTSLGEMHVFCDASKRAYGSVAYLQTEDQHGPTEVAFLTARSRVAPKKQQSVPRLELCAALIGAQLAQVLQTELNLPIRHTILWTDSTTVLTWLQSDS